MKHRNSVQVGAWFGAALGFAAGALGDPPHIIDIGVPPGANSSGVTSMTSDGTVVLALTDIGVAWWTVWGSWEVLAPPWGAGNSIADAIMSADGSTIVGTERSTRFYGHIGAVRWTGAAWEYLASAPSAATAISADGSMIAGGIFAGSHHFPTQPVRWTPTGADLIEVPQFGMPFGITPDGSTVVGGPWPLAMEGAAWRWTPGGGTEHLPFLPGSTSYLCWATAISADGNVIAGTCSPDQTSAWRPVVWTHGAIEALDRLPHWERPEVHSLSADGSVAAGEIFFSNGANIAAIWTSAGAFDLNDYLPTLGIDLTGWNLTSARQINHDGTIIGGGGTLNGQLRGWIAHLTDSSCYANCDNSTSEPILTVDDFTCFINEFSSALQLPHEQQVTHFANCDGSTTAPVLTVDDFRCFINAFAQGCP